MTWFSSVFFGVTGGSSAYDQSELMQMHLPGNLPLLQMKNHFLVLSSRQRLLKLSLSFSEM